MSMDNAKEPMPKTREWAVKWADVLQSQNTDFIILDFIHPDNAYPELKQEAFTPEYEALADERGLHLSYWSHSIEFGEEAFDLFAIILSKTPEVQEEAVTQAFAQQMPVKITAQDDPEKEVPASEIERVSKRLA